MGIEDKKSRIIKEIYGQEALHVRIEPSTDDSVTYEYSVPFGYHGVEGVPSEAQGLTLTVSSEHTAGHYPQIPVFPGYKTLELGAKLQPGRVITVTDALFSQMVVPGHVITAALTDMGRTEVSRGEHTVASMLITHDLASGGLDLSGIFLEICAQSIAADTITRIADAALYPLIVGFDSLTVADLAHASELVVVPGTSDLVDTNTYFGNAEVYNKMGGSAVARLEGLRFKPLRRQQLAALHKFAQR